MPFPTAKIVLSLILAGTVCAVGPAQAPVENAQPLATRQNFFTIPFSVPNPASAAEVHLYVSADQGRTWQLYTREQPTSGKFQFRAQRDGEYWFASRTLYPQGYAQPPLPQRAELRVLIDTVSPHLDLTAEVGQAGEVATAWEISDPNLIADSFKIFFRHSSAERWQPVAVEMPTDAARDQLSGRTTWWPQRHGTTLEVRAEVQDRAGNTNVVQRSLQLPNLAEHGGGQNALELQPPSQNRFVNNPVEWPADDVVNDAAPPENVRTEGHHAFTSNSFAPQPRENPAKPQAAAVAPEVAHCAETPDRTTGPFDLPPGEHPQMTRSRRFNLDYSIDGVGPSGVARVELWATRDGGRLWQQWGTDDDRRSPMPIEVDAEGIYGFRIIVQSGNGLVSARPRSGDPAEVWIGLDETQPEAQITSAQYGRGQQVGTLSIFWQASDTALHPRPVTLLFQRLARRTVEHRRRRPAERWPLRLAGG